MPRVKMTKTLASPSEIYQKGAIIDVSNERAVALLEDEACELLGEAEPKPGTAYEDGEKFAALQAAEAAQQAAPQAATAAAGTAPSETTGADASESRSADASETPSEAPAEAVDETPASSETATSAPSETATAAPQSDRTRTRRARPTS